MRQWLFLTGYKGDINTRVIQSRVHINVKSPHGVFFLLVIQCNAVCGRINHAEKMEICHSWQIWENQKQEMMHAVWKGRGGYTDDKKK